MDVYVVEYHYHEYEPTPSVSYLNVQTSVNIVGIKSGTTYEIRIAVRNENGLSAFGPLSKVTTPTTNPPSGPSTTYKEGIILTGNYVGKISVLVIAFKLAIKLQNWKRMNFWPEDIWVGKII